MGYKITLVDGLPDMSYDADATIATDLLLSALVPQGAFFLDPTFGLRAMQKKITDKNVGQVKDYFKESCKWLITSGKAESIDVLVESDLTGKTQIDVKETAVQADNTVATFETFVPVV